MRLRYLVSLLRSALQGQSTVMEAAGDNARFHVWSGDEFIDDPAEPVVYLVRPIPRAYYNQLVAASPERMHVIQRPVDPHLRLLA